MPDEMIIGVDPGNEDATLIALCSGRSIQVIEPRIRNEWTVAEMAELNVERHSTRLRQAEALLVLMGHITVRPFTMFEFLERGPRRPMFTFKPCGSTQEECLAELKEKLPHGVTVEDMQKGRRYA